MADKLEKLRNLAQRLKDKVYMPQVNAVGREKVDQLVTKYVPAAKVNEMAQKFKQENITKKVKDLVSKYEKFTGVEEIMALQNTVIDAQVGFFKNFFFMSLVYLSDLPIKIKYFLCNQCKSNHIIL